MNFIKVNKDNWTRAKVFEQYTKVTPCTYSMTVNLDITKLKNKIDKRCLKFFPVFLYALSKFANKYTEFRMDFDEHGDLGYYDKINPIFIIFEEKQEYFYQIWTEYNNDFEKFYENYLEDMKNYQMAEVKQSKPLAYKNVFNVSCVPWISFTGFNLNLAKGYDYCLPIFTVGKYFFQNGVILLPLAIQVHHGVCDGYHISRFINDLQDWLNTTTEL